MPVFSTSIMTLDWDWAAAETEGQRALAIDPTNPDVLNIAGRLSMTLGRWDDAERQFRAALVRDPLNTYVICEPRNDLLPRGSIRRGRRHVPKVARGRAGFRVDSQVSRQDAAGAGQSRRRRLPWCSRKSTRRID